jgi:hypothetical protein
MHLFMSGCFLNLARYDCVWVGTANYSKYFKEYDGVGIRSCDAKSKN